MRGLKTNTAYTHTCISNLDIFAISERWLHSFKLNQLAVFHPEFSFHAASHPTDKDMTYCIPRTIRDQGGVAVAWRKSLNHLTSPQDLEPPTNSKRHLTSWMQPLASMMMYIFLETLTQTSEQKVAPKHVHLPMSTAVSYSNIYTDGNTYLITLHLSPSQSTHTDESEAHGSLSTIDHFLGPPHMLSSISKCVVGEEDPTNTSDHLPILAQMELCFHPHTAPSPVEPQNQMHSKTNSHLWR